MIAARTAASDFNERKRKIDRKQKEIEETIKKLKDMRCHFHKRKRTKEAKKANPGRGLSSSR